MSRNTGFGAGFGLGFGAGFGTDLSVIASYAYKGAVEPSEVSASGNEYQGYKGAIEPQVGGSTVTVSASTDALVLTAYPATLNFSWTVAATTDALVISTLPASIVVTGAVSSELQTYKGAVEPAAVGGSGNEHQAHKGAIEPTAVSGVTVQASLDALTLTTYAASIGLDGVVNATTDALVLLTYPASISAIVQTSSEYKAYKGAVEPAELGGSGNEFQGYKGAIEPLGVDSNIVNAGVDALTLTEYPASIESDISVAVTTQALVLTEYAATINFDATINVSSQALTLTTYPASLPLPPDVSLRFIAPSRQRKILSSPAHPLRVRGLLSRFRSMRSIVNTSSQALTLTEYPASIEVVAEINASSQALVLAENPASIVIDTTVNAGIQALTLTENAVTVDVASGLMAEISPYLWLQPTAINGPGYNAARGAEDFDLTGSVTYDIDAHGKEVIQMTGADRLDGKVGSFAGTILSELHNQSQGWVLVGLNPQGDTTALQVGLQTADGNNAGIRMRMGSTDGSGIFFIGDGTSNVTITPPLGEFGDFDLNDSNVWLLVIDVPGGYMEAWTNNRTRRSLTFKRKDISGLSFPDISTPRPNTVVPRCDLNGDVWLAAGDVIPSDESIEQLMMYGAGRTFASINSVTSIVARQRYCRVTPTENSLRIVGNFTQAPIINVYPDTGRTTRGALVSTSTTPVALDAQGWLAFTMPDALTTDTAYKVHFAYADGAEDRRRARAKTLKSTRSGSSFGFSSCMRFDPAISFDDVVSTEAASQLVMHSITHADLDAFVLVGDHFYPDDMALDLGNPVPILDLDEYTEAVLYPADQMKVSHLFDHVSFLEGNFSDHDFLQNDVFGADAVPGQIATAQSHWTQRTGRVYPLAPANMYYTWQTSGLTWIATDTRTEAEAGVQLMSTGQLDQMESDMTAAVARGDFIMLLTEFPFDEGETPSPPGSWNNFTAQRTDFQNRMANAGAEDRVIAVYGDHHAGGVDLNGTFQGGFDTGGIVRPIGILASRMNSPNVGSPAGISVNPDYYDGGNGHWMKVDLLDIGDQLQVTITPYENTTAKTPLVRVLGSSRINHLHKGAIEPAETPSGNEYQSYKGAIEPQ